nr:MAG TPA: hypothetical protein [Caudoviricetes sp.]
MADIETATRNYRDLFSFKDYSLELAKKYFPDQDISTLNVGMIGYVSELLGTATEDSFNTISVLIKEMFPNKAQLPESIYSHAAIFQLANSFASAAACRFLLIFQEETISQKMDEVNGLGNNISTIYLDKDTQIIVEDIIFTLDYDISITRKVVNGETIYSAKYETLPFTNSISEISNPYIKVRKSKENFLALEIIGHQCIRTEEVEAIINNTKINYPTIDIPFEGKLAGIDVLYKTPSDDDFNTQMKTLVVESQAIEEPFCFYRVKDEGVLQISFSNIDTYFQPRFNSEIKVIMYITDGKEGNFDVYKGSNIEVICNSDNYWYNTNIVFGAYTVSGSTGGSDSLTLDELQELVVEEYSTAHALTTDNDLEMYFRNYQYRYNNNIKFIKRRDDVAERLFSGYLIMSDAGYIYPTNTLDLSINYLDMYNPTEGYLYTMDPGVIFTYEEGRIDRLVPVFKQEYQERLSLYYDWCHKKHPDEAYGVADKDNPFSEWGKKFQYSQEYYVNHSELEETYENSVLYATAVMNGEETFDYVGYHNWNAPDGKDFLTIYDDELFSVIENDPKGFYFSNPFLIALTVKPNIFGYYLTIADQYSLLDFTDFNDDSFMQFIMTQLHMERIMSNDKTYTFTIEMLPSIKSEAEDLIPSYFGITKKNEDGTSEVVYPSYKENPLRVILVFQNAVQEDSCYIELIPTAVGTEDKITFTGTFSTDDHITTSGSFRVMASNDDYPDIVYMTNSESMMLPMEDVTAKIYTLYREPETEYTRKTENYFVKYDSTLAEYSWTNVFSTYSDPLTFIKPMNMIRSNVYFRDDRAIKINTGDIYIYSMPFFKYELMVHRKDTGEENTDMKAKFNKLISDYLLQYENLETVLNSTLRNTSHIDVKFYNTYGKSKNYLIGDNEELIDRVNISIKFDVYVSQGTDIVAAKKNIQVFIKENVETINTLGSNDLFISNLIRKIENNFAYVDHLKFRGINDYSTDYQTISNITKDLNDLNKDERYKYIPEMLVCNTEDIYLTMIEVQ